MKPNPLSCTSFLILPIAITHTPRQALHTRAGYNATPTLSSCYLTKLGEDGQRKERPEVAISRGGSLVGAKPKIGNPKRHSRPGQTARRRPDDLRATTT